MQPTNSSATRRIWTGNSIAPWTNWSVCNGSTEVKACRRLSTLIWVRRLRVFAKQSQEVIYFQRGFGDKPSIALDFEWVSKNRGPEEEEPRRVVCPCRDGRSYRAAALLFPARGWTATIWPIHSQPQNRLVQAVARECNKFHLRRFPTNSQLNSIDIPRHSIARFLTLRPERFSMGGAQDVSRFGASFRRCASDPLRAADLGVQ